jgi:Ala-tRNA(Pro) deacylase
VAEAEWISCHPCICSSSLKLRTRDVLDILLPRIGHVPTIVDLPEEDE